MEFIEERNKKEEKIEIGDLIKMPNGEYRIIWYDYEDGTFSSYDLKGNLAVKSRDLEYLIKINDYTLVAKSKDLEIRIKK